MKKILIMMSILIGGLTTVSCDEKQSLYDKQVKDFTHTWHSAEVIDSVGIRVNKFKYEGCDYLFFLAPHKGGDCVVHNPKCKNPEHNR